MMTVLWPPYMSNCVSRQCHLTSGGFHLSKVLLTGCHCWWQLERRQCSRVLLM